MKTTFETGLAKCRCRNCDNKIEFSADEAGREATCPICGLETLLYIPPVPPVAAAPAFPPQAARPARDGNITHKKIRPTIIGPLILCAIGVGLIVSGCWAESLAKSAMHQTTAAVPRICGLLGNRSAATDG
jgi:hypothetical protein